MHFVNIVLLIQQTMHAYDEQASYLVPGESTRHIFSWDVQNITWDDQLSCAVVFKTWSPKSAVENLISCRVDLERAGHIEKFLLTVGTGDSGFAIQDLVVTACPDNFSLGVTLSLTC